MGPRVLIISQGCWKDDNSFGNTFSSFFRDYDTDSIAHIYTDPDLPRNNCCKYYYQISEKDVVSSVLRRTRIKGKPVLIHSGSYDYNSDESKKSISKHPFLRGSISAKWARNLIWILSNIDFNEVVEYVSDFNPQIVFLCLNRNLFIHRIQREICKKTKAKVVMYTADDAYSLKQFSLSPLFWIDRFIVRSHITKTMKYVNSLYVISKEQLEEYSKTFNVNCRILRKKCRVENEEIINEYNYPLDIVYTGNLLLNRWKTIYRFGKVLSKEKNQNVGIISVYSSGDISQKIENKLNSLSTVRFCGKLLPEEVVERQRKADVLLHCEPFDLKNRLIVRLSFSTKIIDYLSRGKCILAIGPKEVSSMSFIRNNKLGICVSNNHEIKKAILSLKDPSQIESNSKKSLEFAEIDAHSESIERMLMRELTDTKG